LRSFTGRFALSLFDFAWLAKGGEFIMPAAASAPLFAELEGVASSGSPDRLNRAPASKAQITQLFETLSLFVAQPTIWFWSDRSSAGTTSGA
jgi:hypothetical protein